MAGYITYWPKEQIKKLQKEKDNGPIKVIFGSVHTKMPSIKKVKAGDTVYPVTIDNGTLCVVAKLPVEQIEDAYEYLVRELGNQCGALTLEGVDPMEYYNSPMKSHMCHQQPFNCCSETAAIGTNGTSIKLRPIPKEKLPELLFGPSKSKQRPILLNDKGSPKVISISSNVRKMSDETQKIFDSLF